MFIEVPPISFQIFHNSSKHSDSLGHPVFLWLYSHLQNCRALSQSPGAVSCVPLGVCYSCSAGSHTHFLQLPLGGPVPRAFLQLLKLTLLLRVLDGGRVAVWSSILSLDQASGLDSPSHGSFLSQGSPQPHKIQLALEPC